MTKVNFVSTRPNTTVPFWWESTNATIVNYRQVVQNNATELGLTAESQISADLLTYTYTYLVPNSESWVAFKNTLLPEIKSYRNNYFRTNNHTLTVTVIEADTNEVLENISVIS